MVELRMTEPGEIRVQNERLLSVPMQEVIDRIPPNIPQVFKDQAIQTARLIEDLDSGKPPTDPVTKRFVTELGSTGFISWVRFVSGHTFFRGAPDSEVALPFWLQAKYLRENGCIENNSRLMTGVEKESSQDIFNKWVTENGYYEDKRKDGTYYTVYGDGSPKHVISAKIYLEKISLLDSLTTGQLRAIVDRYARTKKGPDLMKLNESDRLVLYFPDSNTSEFEQALKKANIQFRGPAEDPGEIIVTEKGDLAIPEERELSNDSSLGEGDHLPDDLKYNLREYSPEGFLEDYLNLCLHSGRNPADPYRQSFIPVVDEDGKLAGKINATLSKAKTMVYPYPVIYTGYKFEIRLADKNGSNNNINIFPQIDKPKSRGFWGFLRKK